MTHTLAVCSVEYVEARIAPLQARLTAHPLYHRIQSLRDIHAFMESHVFAVWDFMSLLKTLQAQLTCVTVPWGPSPFPESRRFINEIVLGEESDLFEGRPVSHFELYLEAMRECGADTQAIQNLLMQMQTGNANVELADAALPRAARAFMETTFACIHEGKPHAIAAAFTFGREDVIPDMFRNLVRDLDGRLSGQLGKFVWYLERHIQVDGEDHGPLSLRMVADLCGSDPEKWEDAAEAAEQAITARLALWDGILAQLANG